MNDAGGSPVATQVFQVTGTGATMTITDLIPRDIESQEPLRVSQIQLLDGGQVLQVSDANSDAAHTLKTDLYGITEGQPIPLGLATIILG